jgi:hypothetical protein
MFKLRSSGLEDSKSIKVDPAQIIIAYNVVGCRNETGHGVACRDQSGAQTG